MDPNLGGRRRRIHFRFPKIDFQEPLKVEIDHFIDCIQNGTKCFTGIDHARKVVQILSENGQ